MFKRIVNCTFDRASPEYGNMRRQFFWGCTGPYFGPTKGSHRLPNWMFFYTKYVTNSQISPNFNNC